MREFVSFSNRDDETKQDPGTRQQLIPCFLKKNPGLDVEPNSQFPNQH